MNPETGPQRPFSRILETLPGAYFREAADTFSRAVAARGISDDVFLDVAGVPFRVCFSGDSTAKLILPALAHLIRAEKGKARWTIHCWDDASTGSLMPVPLPQMRNNHRMNCLHDLSDERYRAFYQEWMETFSFIDREGEAYACYLEADKLPMYEKAAPMRQIFNTALNLHGRQIVHAASVGYSHGSVLLAGPPRSGKSTLAVQCLLQGMGYQSDDLCVISQEGPPQSWSLYNVAKLREDSLSRVEAGVPLISFTEGEETKHYFHVNRVFPERILPVAPIKALVIPQITGENLSRIEPAGRLEAMKALIPWSVSEVPTSDNLGEKIMLKAVSQIPAYNLYLGSDCKQSFNLIRNLIHAS